MPQSPKTTGFTPTIKSEMEAKCLSANSANNNNTIFNFPTVPTSSDDKSRSNDVLTSNGGIQYTSHSAQMRHHEGKQLDVNDVNVNVGVVASCASSTHETVSTSSYSLSSSELITNRNSNSTSTNQSSSNVNVINVCDGSDKTNTGATSHGIIIAESHDGGGFYDAIKLEESDGGGATAIIYETIVIESPPSGGAFVNNNKMIANKNMTLEGVGNGGIIVLTAGSLNEFLLGQGGHVITNVGQASQGAGANTKCLNDVTNPNHMNTIVLNLNSQSSASAVNVGSGQMTPGGQKSIMVAINPNQQVSYAFDSSRMDFGLTGCACSR